MTILVLGHKNPDTDSTGSPIIWAWYLESVLGKFAEAVLLGPPNSEAAFVLEQWQVATPRVIDHLPKDSKVFVVDTNNADELPDEISDSEIVGIIDHHKLTPGLATDYAIEVSIRPYACCATVICELMGDAVVTSMSRELKGICLSCIISDTLAFRSPTTTDLDRTLATRLASDVGVRIDEYAAQMFSAKSDISHLSASNLLNYDAKTYEIAGVRYLVSVFETVDPQSLLARKAELMRSMPDAVRAAGVDRVLFFVIDILEEQAILLVPEDDTREIARSGFDVLADTDTVILPGVISRKKQIVPRLMQMPIGGDEA